jgi:acetolactate synthase regulatory subunit
MDARFDVLRRLNLRGMIAGAMPMDYHKVANEVSIEQYVRDVVAGNRYDTNLTKQLHKGFKVQNLIPEYIYDPRTNNWGVAILWENPDYTPGKAAEPLLFDINRYAVKLKPAFSLYPMSAAGS